MYPPSLRSISWVIFLDMHRNCSTNQRQGKDVNSALCNQSLIRPGLYDNDRLPKCAEMIEDFWCPDRNTCIPGELGQCHVSCCPRSGLHQGISSHGTDCIGETGPCLSQRRIWSICVIPISSSDRRHRYGFIYNQGPMRPYHINRGQWINRLCFHGFCPGKELLKLFWFLGW